MLLRHSIRDVEAELKTLTNNKTRGEGWPDKRQKMLPKHHQKWAKLQKKTRTIKSEHVKPSWIDGTTIWNKWVNVRGGGGWPSWRFLWRSLFLRKKWVQIRSLCKRPSKWDMKGKTDKDKIVKHKGGHGLTFGESSRPEEKEKPSLRCLVS